MKRKIMSEEECLNHGGHYWNYHSANTAVNEFGEPIGQQYLVYYPSGKEPQFRTCKLCCKKQKLFQEWKNVEVKK